MKRLEDLQAYVTGELDAPAAEAFEEAMFAAPDDADISFLDRVVRQGAQLVANGTFDVGVTKAHLDQLIATGHKVQISDAGPPGMKEFEIDKSCELFATVLAIGRKDLARVDVEIFLPDHNATKTIKDVPVDQNDGTVYGMCERPLAVLAFGARSHVKVRETTGARTVIAEWDLVGHVAR